MLSNQIPNKTETWAERGYTFSSQTADFPKQKGQTCALNSMAAAAKALGVQCPPPIANGDRKVESLRKMAKNIGLSQIGEVYDTEDFTRLAELAGFQASSIYNDAESVGFMNILIDNLKQGRVIALPIETYEAEAHWVLVIGFSECPTYSGLSKFLYTEYGKCFFEFSDLLWERNNTIFDRNQRHYHKKGPIRENIGYKACSEKDPGAITLPAVLASETLANRMVVLQKKPSVSLPVPLETVNKRERNKDSL